MLRGRLLLAMVVFLLVFPVMAGSQAFPRPRIGVALSGGAQRGCAHIGVLQWMEEHHIPIDCISGTSMGGLIGGMYAAGISPVEMRHLLAAIDWDDAFRGEPNYRVLSFRRKEDRRDMPVSLEIGLKDGVKLPSGLDPVHPIGLLLSRVALPYSDLRDFDVLPVPFRAAAVDLQTGQTVIMRDGSLASALRATMAVPGVFTPVERNGHLLVDGGILCNLPTEAVREMGADVIIAVDVTPTLVSRRDLESIFGVVEQSVAIVLLNNARKSMELADIVIRPDLRGIESEGYESSNAFADRGMQIPPARAKMLEALALPPDQWAEYVRQRDARKRTTIPVPSYVRVTGASPAAGRGVERALHSYVARPVDTSRLEHDLTLFTGNGRFLSLSYSMERRGDTEGLLVHAEEKRHAPPFANFALDVNGAEMESVTVSAGARVTALDVAGPRAEWRTDVLLGSTARIGSELYLPVPSTRLFFAPYSRYYSRKTDLFSEGNRVAEYRMIDNVIGIDAGYAFGPSAEARVGYEFGRADASIRTGDPLLPHDKGEISAMTAQYVLDTENNPQVPTQGVRMQLSGKWLMEVPGAGSGIPLAEGNISLFTPVSGSNVAVALASAGTSFGYTAPSMQQFTLGGPMRLTAYSPDEFRGNHYLHLGLGVMHRIGALPRYVGGPMYLGLIGETGGVFNRFADGRYNMCASLGLVAETAIGPLYVGGAIGEAGHRKLFFSLGRLF